MKGTEYNVFLYGGFVLLKLLKLKFANSFSVVKQFRIRWIKRVQCYNMNRIFEIEISEFPTNILGFDAICRNSRIKRPSQVVKG